MVVTTLMQKDCPDPILEDSRGTLIVSGARVAYNLSGNVVLGVLQGMNSSWTQIRPGANNTSWWNCKFNAFIVNEKGEVSTVKNPNSFVILP